MSGRFDRQTRLPDVGEAGAARIRDATVAVVGVGALGTVAAEILARSGVGTLVLMDGDVVELSNLQRQALFTTRHAEEGTPKVLAAAETLAAIAPDTRVVPHLCRLDGANAAQRLAGANVIADGLDNVETRLLLNEYAVREGVPYVYGGAVGHEGLVFPVLPGRGPCLQCLFPDPPRAGELPTCDTAGVFGPLTHLVGSLIAAHVLRIVLDDAPAVGLTRVGTNPPAAHTRPLGADHRDPSCAVCAERRFDRLSLARRETAAAVCGRNAVEVMPARDTAIDLPRLAERLGPAGAVRLRPALLRFCPSEGVEITVFADGRALVAGTSDGAAALALYARWIGA